MRAETGTWLEAEVLGRRLRLYNQRRREWDIPYDNKTPAVCTLAQAGCGIFSLAQAVEWMTGRRVDIAALAAFSLENGGRGDDGTDRPALLRALMQSGEAARLGFRYEGGGLRNDRDALYAHLAAGAGAALCNLRAGHIVTLAAARTVNGERQVLALDPYSESADERVRGHVRECLAQTQVVSAIENERGVRTGTLCSFAAFWAALAAVRDFNLLHAAR